MNQIRQYIPHGGNSAPRDVEGKLQDEYNATKILHQAKKTLETTGKKSRFSFEERKKEARLVVIL